MRNDIKYAKAPLIVKDVLILCLGRYLNINAIIMQRKNTCIHGQYLFNIINIGRCVLYVRRRILLTKTTAARNESALSYLKVRGIYILAVVFVTTIVMFYILQQGIAFTWLTKK